MRSVAEAAAYRDRILATIPAGRQVKPLRTLYLADNTNPDEIRAAKAAGVVKPVGSAYTIGSITACQSLIVELDSSSEIGLPLMKIVGVDQTTRLIA